MSDRFFFPLAALIAALFVFVAMDPFTERAPSGPVSGGGRDAGDVTVQGAELHRFQTGDSKGLSIAVPESGGPATARITRMAEEQYQDPRSGPHLVLAEDVEYALESRPIEVTIVARGIGDFAASEFEANYMARAGDESGWQAFPLTMEFAPYTFAYTTPPRGDTVGYDFLGVRPVAPDKRRSMEIQSVRVRAAGPKIAPQESGSPATP